MNMTGPHDNLLAQRRLGRSGIRVTGIGVGGSPIGLPALYGNAAAPDGAVATVRRVLAGPIAFLDTSNCYGDSERYIGTALADTGGLPDGFVLATKVDADPLTGDFSGVRVRRSFAESRSRLGVDRFELLHLHDPENHISFADAMRPGGPVEALRALRDEGLAGSIGIAGGTVSEMRRYVESGAFDVLLTHSRLTLVDRSACALVERASDLGLGVINAAPFGGGVLARRPRPDARYAYGLGSPQQVAAARRMHEAADEAGVPLAAAALRFAATAAGVDAVLAGVSTPARIDELERLALMPIPPGLLEELDRLSPPAAAWIPR